MKIKSLTLVNFKGLLAGVGLPEVNIDLSTASGLVAIVGGNGMGKTTILDNLHPYRIMPYKLRKAASWSPAAFSYYDQCEGEAKKDIVFEIGGETYRSTILIDTKRRKQEAYLYKQSGSGWSPLVDGKTKNYDEAIERICGSPSLFFTSVFRAQGAKNLSDYSRSDIMSVVSELLNIDHIKQQGLKAKAVADSLLKQRDVFSSEANRLETELMRLGDIEGRLADATAQRDNLLADVAVKESALATVTADILSAERDLATARAQLAQVEEKRKAVDAARAELKEALSRRNSAMADLGRRRESLVSGDARAMADYDRDLAALMDDYNDRRSRLERAREASQAVIDRLSKIAQNEQSIRDAVVRSDDVTKSRETEKLRLAGLESSLSDLRLLQADLDKSRSQLNVLTARHESLSRQAEAMADLDCRGDGSGWINEQCRLLAGAVDAKRQAAELAKQIASVQSACDALSAKIGNASIADSEQEIRSSRKLVADFEAQLADLNRYTRLVPELESAKERLSEEQGKLSELASDTASLEQWKASKVSSLAESKSESHQASLAALASLDRDMAEANSRMQREITLLQAKVSDLDLDLLSCSVDNAPLENRLASLVRESDVQKGMLQSARNSLSLIDTDLGGLREKSKTADRLKKQRLSFSGQAETFDGQIADWRLLQKACSNDGIITLEIDDAGPSIATIANDLMLSCYGPRYSVRIETQAEKLDGNMKESFDITVFDSVNNEEKSITDMSGGQICWIEDALTRAICLFNIGRSEIAYGTLFSDEKDGALDADRKNEFMAVKRRSFDLGGHAMEIFITQTPELIELADSVIRLEPGAVEVV